jgi:hypothetical protein
MSLSAQHDFSVNEELQGMKFNLLLVWVWTPTESNVKYVATFIQTGNILIEKYACVVDNSEQNVLNEQLYHLGYNSI